MMSVWVWMLQVLVFFVALKVGQVVFWNLRKAFYVHPWAVELLVAVIFMLALVFEVGGWWAPLLYGALFGVIRGDQEEAQPRRQLL